MAVALGVINVALAAAGSESPRFARLSVEDDPAGTVSIGFTAFPFLPHEPEALSWEQTLELADHALRLTKRRRRNSYSGLRATDGLTAASVLEFLAASGAALLPATVEIVVPDDGADGTREPN